MEWTKRSIAIEGTELYVEEAGAGEPLLLLHGLTGTGADFWHVFELDALAETHRVILPDARGHGRCEPRRQDAPARGDRGASASRRDDPGLGNTSLPEATRAVLRAAATAEHTPAEWAAMRALHVHGDEQIAALWHLPSRFAEDASDMSFTPNRLASVAARTLIVNGDRDPLYPVKFAVELFRGIPGASLWVAPGGGHGPIFLSERESFVRVARPFLSS